MAKILIVEDEATILLLVKSVLKHAGHDTLTASTLTEAQAILDSDQHLDLVVTDIQLGEGTEAGIQIGQIIAQSRAGTPVIYASGRALTDGMQQLLVEPSVFVPKPYTDEKMLAALLEDMLRDSGKK